MAKWDSKKKKVIKNELMKNIGYYRCSMCFETSEDSDFVHLDHIMPKKLGGKDTVDNMDLLCKSCNSSRGPRIGFERPKIALRDMENNLSRLNVNQLKYEVKHGHIKKNDLEAFEEEVATRIENIKIDFLSILKELE